MNAKLKNGLAMLLLAGMTACFPQTESEMDKIVDRDDAILKAYMANNQIEAEKTQAGYYYTKLVKVENAPQISNNTILGIYYEVKSIDGHIIDVHGEEDGEPLLFVHGELGIVPQVINMVTGIASVGETIQVYSPSYLGYFDYSFGQLIPANSNLVITLHIAKKYTLEEIKELEDAQIQAYLELNNLEGYEKLPSGAYVKVLEEGEMDSPVIKSADQLMVNFELFHLSDTEPFSKRSEAGGAFYFRAGSSDNLKFLNLVSINSKISSKMEIIAPSHLAYGATLQVIPQEIREDLFRKNLISQRVRPFAPIRFVVDFVGKA